MKIFENFDLTEFNSYKIKSHCKTAYFPETEEDVVFLFKKLNDFKLIGSGNNIILSEPYYDCNFIIFNENYNKIDVDLSQDVIVAETGAKFYDISNVALQNSLTGLEFCYDIPSSVGGGVIMNAGTKEGEIKDILSKVRYLDLDEMKVKEKSSDELNLRYRNSVFQDQKNKIVLKAWFKLSKGCKESIKKVMIDSKERRWQKQPRNYPNCGSVFKRPPNRFVGPMLDELKLKGTSVGGAMVSKKHSGFIINNNNASGQDVLKLIEKIKAAVKIHFDIDLEVEQRII